MTEYFKLLHGTLGAKMFRVGDFWLETRVIVKTFELMMERITTVLIEPHQVPWHPSILLTQGPMHEI